MLNFAHGNNNAWCFPSRTLCYSYENKLSVINNDHIDLGRAFYTSGYLLFTIFLSTENEPAEIIYSPLSAKTELSPTDELKNKDHGVSMSPSRIFLLKEDSYQVRTLSYLAIQALYCRQWIYSNRLCRLLVATSKVHFDKTLVKVMMILSK